MVGACGIHPLYQHNGRRVHANSYAFALSVPACVAGGIVKRTKSPLPGERRSYSKKKFLVKTDHLLSHYPVDVVRQELTARILADNPHAVRLIQGPYTLKLIETGLRGEKRCQAHMFACTFGKIDVRFMRRLFLSSVLQNLDKIQPLTEDQFYRLKAGGRNASVRMGVPAGHVQT